MMDHDFYIKKCRESDLSLLKIRFPDDSRSWKHFDYYRNQEEGKSEYLLLWKKDSLIAHLVLSYDNDLVVGCPEISNLFVLNDFRRVGVATYLLEYAERIFKKKFSSIVVTVNPNNTAALNLYIKNGYIVLPNPKYETLWCLVKEI